MKRIVRKVVQALPGGRAFLRARKDIDRSAVLAALPQSSVGAEIGVHLGAFSEKILDAVQPARLYLIDPWRYESDEMYRQSWYGGAAGRSQNHMDERYHSVLQRFSDHIKTGVVSVVRDTSEHALSELPDDSLDWVYIDGNHFYDAVKTDLTLSYRKVKAGGIIAGDDYTATGWWEGGVKKAVDEFVREAPVKHLHLSASQFVLRKIR